MVSVPLCRGRQNEAPWGEGTCLSGSPPSPGPARCVAQSRCSTFTGDATGLPLPKIPRADRSAKCGPGEPGARPPSPQPKTRNGFGFVRRGGSIERETYPLSSTVGLSGSREEHGGCWRQLFRERKPLVTRDECGLRTWSLAAASGNAEADCVVGFPGTGRPWHH